jgi:hypothetical protein
MTAKFVSGEAPVPSDLLYYSNMCYLASNSSPDVS